MDFKEMIEQDNTTVFLNLREFAMYHNLNGIKCKAIVQDISVADNFSTNSGVNDLSYAGLYGSRVQVNCLKADLPEVPVYGQTFTLDGDMYLVESCSDDMGILTIQMVENSR